MKKRKEGKRKEWWADFADSLAHPTREKKASANGLARHNRMVHYLYGLTEDEIRITECGG